MNRAMRRARLAFSPPARAPPAYSPSRPPAVRKRWAGSFLHVLLPGPSRPSMPRHTPPAPPRCRCGRLREKERPECCGPCATGRHNTACNMRQVSLAEAAGRAPSPSFAFVAIADPLTTPLPDHLT
jgi:hypothetical protein